MPHESSNTFWQERRAKLVDMRSVDVAQRAGAVRELFQRGKYGLGNLFLQLDIAQLDLVLHVIPVVCDELHIT